ncbi:MAG: hypothetical protein E7670_08730 [Ruminococcaceae bacterium]|nr:hypothetical protein [Oscillospiraceae bacterium]
MEIHSSYERVIPKKSTKRKIFGICAYVVLGIVGFVVAFNTGSIYVLALAIAVEASVILLTKKYLSVELEYSFIGGIFTVSKIYGKRSRKTLEDIELSSCIIIDYATEQTMVRVNSMNTSDKLLDVSSENADGDVLVALWEVDKNREAILFNADERTLKILYKANAQSCSQEIRVKAR